MTIGENIRKYRKSLRMTQEELAEKMKVIQPNIHRWEKGVVTPSIETIKKLALILKVSADGLLFSEDEHQQLQISDKELLERIKDIEQLTNEDRQALLHLIDAFKEKNKSRRKSK